MIRKLLIDGLRGFEHFELNDLGRLNLLVGTNNCGKTTVLESVQLLATEGDTQSVFRILSRRGEDWFDTSERGRSIRHVDIRRLFYGHEIAPGKRFDVRGLTSSKIRSFTAEIVEPSEEANSGTSSQLFDNDSNQSETDDLLAPLAISFSWDLDDLPPHSAGRSTWDRAGPTLVATINRRGGLPIDAFRRSAAVADASSAKGQAYRDGIAVP